jgi:16S rRNA (cytosine967-C5)-methyltransferase
VISPARRAVFDILQQVEAGGFASDLLRETELDPRDAGLASQIVFGVLRFRAQLDFLIEHFAGRRRTLDAEVRMALRMGIFQLRYLERVPAHAAVTESVELVKRARKASAAGYVNAVLRRTDRSVINWPNREIECSCPEWLLARWDRHFGAGVAERIAKAALLEPEAYVRGDRIQDIGAQSIVPMLGLEAGQRFLDLCAAPGNKTAQALESGVRAIACDVSLRRLKELRPLPVDLVVLDGTGPLPFSRPFDRILVDAPCAGTGTLGRNPEIKWRLRPEDLAGFRERQRALLEQARACLAPAGRLVYSTCSLEPEENEEVAASVAPGLLLETGYRVPGQDPGDGFFSAVIKSG